jgi:hypothetical protein
MAGRRNTGRGHALLDNHEVRAARVDDLARGLAKAGGDRFEGNYRRDADTDAQQVRPVRIR